MCRDYLLRVDYNYLIEVDSKEKKTSNESIVGYFEGLHKIDITMMNYGAIAAVFQTVRDYCKIQV